MKHLRKTKAVQQSVKVAIGYLTAIAEEVDSEECQQEFAAGDPTGDEGCLCDRCQRAETLYLAIAWIRQSIQPRKKP
jgi:hypothetical protein